MKPIYKKIWFAPLLFVFFIAILSTTDAQVTSYPVSPLYINIGFNNTNDTITHQGHIISPKFPTSNVDISGSSNVVFKSGTQVELNPGFTAEPNASGSFTAEIDPQINFVLIAPDPASAIVNDTVQVNKWEKLEIGFKLPDEYQAAVDNFFVHYNSQNNGLSSSTSPMLNPYADDSLNVEIHLISPSGRHITKWGFFMRTANFTKAGDPTDSNNQDKLLLDKDSLNPLSPYNWRFRFAPDEEGTWTFNVNISCPADNPTFPTYAFNGFSFVCGSPLTTNHGFLKVNTNNNRYLKFDDGTPFYGIGENMADVYHASTNDNFFHNNYWYYFTKMDFDDYYRSFGEMNEAGANFTRISLLKSNFAVEWQNLGVYDVFDGSTRNCCPENNHKDMNHGNRQYNLWAFDKLLDKAHDNGIYIELTIDPTPPGTAYQNFMWGDHAYAYYTYDTTSNPKYKTDVVKLFSDTKLRYYWKRRYKYIMSRWGYSVNFAAMETFGEIDQVIGYHHAVDTSKGSYCTGNLGIYNSIPGLRGTINNWHTDILGYVKNTLFNNNANPHLTTVSFTDYATGEPHDDIQSISDQVAYYSYLFTNPVIDVVDIHHYFSEKEMFRNSFGIANDFVRNTLGITDKPFHFGEFRCSGDIKVNGISDNVETFDLFNNYDISFHNELWASTFMNTCTSGLTWNGYNVHWWPNANLNSLQYTKVILGKLDTINVTVDNILGHQQSPALHLPGGGDTNFTNKKIYHNFKPLSDFVQMNGNDLSNSGAKQFYDPTQNIECYYLLKGNIEAYGWVHNLNYYWYNNYYYYSDGTNSINYETLNGCMVPSGSTLHIPLPGFVPLSYYSMNFYPTRMGSYSIPSATIVTSDWNGYIDIGYALTNSNYFQCDGIPADDTIHADIAFKISFYSGARISNNTSQDTSSNPNKQPANINVKISPNPSDGIYSITFNNITDQTMTIFIYDAIGKSVFNETVKEIQNTIIDISNQPKGIYYLKLSLNGNTKYFKLVKQ